MNKLIWFITGEILILLIFVAVFYLGFKTGQYVLLDDVTKICKDLTTIKLT